MIDKIPPYTTDAVQNPVRTLVKPGGEEKAASGNGVSSDRVQLSQDYLELAQAQKAMTAAEDIRIEKVEQIRNQIESGNYLIQPAAIAGRMLDEIV
ncbi:MAG: flagellar biosynthesis anti-sigma factor FlgM [Syntrophobacteraceae bacterium]